MTERVAPGKRQCKPSFRTDLGEPPCTNCEHKRRCELQRLACASFDTYTERGRWATDTVREPSHWRWRKLFNQPIEVIP